MPQALPVLSLLAAPTGGPPSIVLHRTTVRRRRDDASTDASAAHCPEPTVLPSVRRSCAQSAAAILCSKPSVVRDGRGALRLAPGLGYMPQSDLPGRLARRVWRSLRSSVGPNALGFKTFLTQ